MTETDKKKIDEIICQNFGKQCQIDDTNRFSLLVSSIYEADAKAWEDQQALRSASDEAAKAFQAPENMSPLAKSILKACQDKSTLETEGAKIALHLHTDYIKYGMEKLETDINILLERPLAEALILHTAPDLMKNDKVLADFEKDPLLTAFVVQGLKENKDIDAYKQAFEQAETERNVKQSTPYPMADIGHGELKRGGWPRLMEWASQQYDYGQEKPQEFVSPFYPGLTYPQIEERLTKINQDDPTFNEAFLLVFERNPDFAETPGAVLYIYEHPKETIASFKKDADLTPQDLINYVKGNQNKLITGAFLHDSVR